MNLHLQVVSGGLSHIIATTLSQIIDINSYPNLRIMGQEFTINSNNCISDLTIKVCSVGKYFRINNDLVSNRKNIFLLGDILEDVNMAKNVDYNNLLTVGFLNKIDFTEKDVKNYFTKYDVVIANEGSMKEVNSLIREIIPKL